MATKKKTPVKDSFRVNSAEFMLDLIEALEEAGERKIQKLKEKLKAKIEAGDEA
jgi:hypothetical protein